ncbi:MAG: Rpn family recombination-promoting nuclease/putative transposase [Paludibacteraceae bacterium]|nr:Rpn family recombination-promoting nuclease/putative transposase [Paludibacteraceae bacterium]
MDKIRYVNPLTDFGFKKNFGDAEVMKAFLTDLLELSSEIKEIKHLDKERPAETQDGRGVVFDLLCETEDGSRFIVEMQKRRQKYFAERIVFYLSREIASQGVKCGEIWDYSLLPVYGVFFMDFHLDEHEPLSLRTIEFVVRETGQVLTDKVKAYTLELPSYVNMPQENCKTRIDYWLYNLANMETMKTDLKFKDKQPAFNVMERLSELSKLSREDSDKYFYELDYYRTIKNAEGYEYELGEKKGRDEGLKQGKLSVAKNMKQEGLDATFIAKVTGLNAEEIGKL